MISGVPQGSILGPLLFSIYLNDLANFIHCTFKLFADNVVLYHQIVSYEDCLFLQDNLNAFMRWCQKWLMRLQPSKCEALCISNKRSPPMFTYSCDGQPLQWKKVVKYLGVHINQHLTWSDHCKAVCSRVTKLLNLLRRMLFCCSPSAKVHCFGALVLPLMQYACPVWLPHYKKDLQLLESVQNRAARWICGARFILPTYAWSPPSRVCMSTLGWPSMNCRLITLSLLLRIVLRFLFMIIFKLILAELVLIPTHF